ncbi:MAG TPA: CdaR family protein [Spirochaetota bacterium]|mgnify:FL=1|nr:CdaR family protein [Spirochaetota bacterium]HPV42670.1 CdaR family protein [Spirochaetota bacterium]
MKVIKDRIMYVVRERDFLAKGVCLLLAVILWAFIISGKTEKLRYKVPLTIKNLPANMAVSGLSGRTSVIILEGKKEELKNVNIKNIRITIDLENASLGGPRDYPVQVEKQEVPEDISISLVDREVTLTIEKKEFKWVRVVPVITGEVGKGKIIIDKQVVPEQVMISGPRSVINDIDTIDTEEVSVENETGEIKRQVGLNAEKYKDVSFSEKNFTVRVLVTDLKDLEVITVPVGVKNAPREYEYEVKDREVEVYIRLAEKQSVAPGDVEAFIDAGKVNARLLLAKEQKDTVVKDLPVVVAGRNINTTDIISVMPKKVLVKITHKQNM